MALNLEVKGDKIKRYCKNCGGKLNIRSYDAMRYDEITGKRMVGYQMICENSEPTSEGNFHEIHDIREETFKELKSILKVVE